MTKVQLDEAVRKLKGETKEALQTVHDNLNNGQRQKLLKNEEIKKLFDRYGVVYTTP